MSVQGGEGVVVDSMEVEQPSILSNDYSSSAMIAPDVTTLEPTGKTNEQRDMIVVSPPSIPTKPENAVVYTPELLQMYYAHLFPFDLLYQWLSYGNQSLIFAHREFSMTIEPKPGEEIYIRYQSFRSKKELAAAIHKRRPIKIDIGAIFSHPPIDKNTVSTNAFVPQSRELVFDIDLTDYDDVRRCGCAGANICKICWQYMTVAVKVLDQGLRQDFDFHHIAWFYSGRRGIHCWVCDENARALTDVGRSAVAKYFEVLLWKHCVVGL